MSYRLPARAPTLRPLRHAINCSCPVHTYSRYLQTYLCRFHDRRGILSVQHHPWLQSRPDTIFEGDFPHTMRQPSASNERARVARTKNAELVYELSNNEVYPCSVQHGPREL